MNEVVRIVVDTAEQRSGVYRALAEMPEVALAVARLPVADYLLGGDLAVERKTAADFAASIADGRLFAQVAALKAAYARPVILLEGALAAARTRMHPNALRGALSYLVAIEGLAVIPAADPAESALLLAQLARHVQHGPKRPPQPVAKPGAEGLAAQQTRLIGALPGVGPSLARVLLGHFGSPGAVLAADAATLRIVPGIGPARAAAIRRTLATPYEPAAEEQPGDRLGVGWLVSDTPGAHPGQRGDGGRTDRPRD